MSERYTRLYYENIHKSSGKIPVAIEAQALLKDNETEGLLAQIKYRNESEKNIKSLTVAINQKDVEGNIIGVPVTHEYKDLSAAPNEDFGSHQPVRLPDDRSRSFDVQIQQAAFDDGSIVSAGNDENDDLPDMNDPDESTRWTGLANPGAASDNSAAAKPNSFALRKILISLAALAGVIAAIALIVTLVLPRVHYSRGEKLAGAKKYTEAALEYTKAGNFKDAKKASGYYLAINKLQKGEYADAKKRLKTLPGYKDADDKLKEANVYQLSEYIEEKGNTNNKGNKYIGTDSSTSDYSGNFGIVREGKESFGFVMTFNSSGYSSAVSMELNPLTDKSAEIKVIIVGDDGYSSMTSHATISLESYHDNATLDFTIDTDYMPTDATDLSQKAVDAAFSQWKVVLGEVDGMTFSDIGFKAYDSEK